MPFLSFQAPAIRRLKSPQHCVAAFAAGTDDSANPGAADEDTIDSVAKSQYLPAGMAYGLFQSFQGGRLCSLERVAPYRRFGAIPDKWGRHPRSLAEVS